MESQNIKPRQPQDEHIVENKELNIWEALIPIFALVAMLAFNVYVFGDNAISGSNQFVLLLGGAVAAIVGFFNKVTFQQMMEEVAENMKSASSAILILLMVGALGGTWLVLQFDDQNSGQRSPPGRGGRLRLSRESRLSNHRSSRHRPG